MESGDDLQRLRAEQAEADVSRLQQEHASKDARIAELKQILQADCVAHYGAEVDKLKEENALLRRSLEMLTKQLDEKDAEIVELKDAVYRLCPPRS
jgi:predicted  nucleic acid-binding Zn-ribbon protein